MAEEYALPISQVKEVIRYNGATKLPNRTKYMDGI
ncbi:chemotaxis protein CheW [Sporomusa sp. KB1]